MKRIIGTALILILAASARTKKTAARPTPLDVYIEQAMKGANAPELVSPGSLFSQGGPFSDSVRDLRASRLYDLVTIIVSDKASAVSSGVTNTSRKSGATASVTALGGAIKATRPLANLANMSGNRQLQSQGTTSRDTALTTTITAHVTHVLPNGNLVVEGQKVININSEHQTVIIRGVVRPADLSPANQVSSDRVSMLDVRVDGKGVVNDAVKRPFILYRLLLGLLPF